MAARRRCKVARTVSDPSRAEPLGSAGAFASSAGVSSKTSVPMISAAPTYARTGVRRRSSAPAPAAGRKRTRKAALGNEGGIGQHRAATELGDLDARDVHRDARAARDVLARAAEHVQRTHADVAPGRIEPQHVADVQRPLHQRPGHDRSVAGQREDAVDRQKRRRFREPRRERDQRVMDRRAQCAEPISR